MVAQLHSPKKILDITGCRMTCGISSFDPVTLVFYSFAKSTFGNKTRSCRKRRHRGQKNISVGFHLLSGRDIEVLPTDLIGTRCVGHLSVSVQFNRQHCWTEGLRVF